MAASPVHAPLGFDALGPSYKILAFADSLHPWQRYLGAVFILLPAYLLRIFIAPVDAGIQYVTFFPSSAIIAAIFGLGPAVVVIISGGLIGQYQFTEPYSSFRVAPDQIITLFAYYTGDFIICFTVSRVRRARHEALAALKSVTIARREAEYARAEAHRANIAKSKFLANASHDLRQPVQSLVLLTQIMREQSAGSPIAPTVEMIEQASHGLQTMLAGLLDLSKLDAGVVVPNFQVINLSDELPRLAREYRLKAESKGLQLQLVKTHASVTSDPAMLERIIRNLIENAICYTTHGGIVIGCRRRGEKVSIQISDTGTGISGEHQKNIFDEFYQVDSSARQYGAGLGLGLSIVQRQAQLLGAEISLQSTPNRGTSFWVTLPRASSTKIIEKNAIVMSTAKYRLVLIIDDDAPIRTGLKMMLESWGYQTAIAANAEDAVDLVKSGLKPDIIVSDFRLGQGMNGINAINTVHTILNHKTPALIITGDTSPERIREVNTSGFSILHKPFAAKELESKLERTSEGL